MSWKESLESAMGDAQSLSNIADFNQLVNLAERVGQDLQAEKVSSRQIRVLLSETTAGVSRIRQGRTLGMVNETGGLPDKAGQDKAAQREAALLNISLVYNAGRDKSGTAAIRQLTDLMGQITRRVHTFEDYKVLRKFSEAIVAYFKFHGGK